MPPSVCGDSGLPAGAATEMPLTSCGDSGLPADAASEMPPSLGGDFGLPAGAATEMPLTSYGESSLPVDAAAGMPPSPCGDSGLPTSAATEMPLTSCGDSSLPADAASGMPPTDRGDSGLPAGAVSEMPSGSGATMAAWLPVLRRHRVPIALCSRLLCDMSRMTAVVDLPRGTWCDAASDDPPTVDVAWPGGDNITAELLDAPPVLCCGGALRSAAMRPLVAEARALATECFHSTCGALITEDANGLWLLVARSRRALLGYALTQEVHLEADRQSVLMLDQLAVAPPLRGWGLGGQLLNSVLRHAAMLKCEFVAVWSLAPALAFYRSLGFRGVSVEARDALQRAGIPGVRDCVLLAMAPPSDVEDMLSVLTDSDLPSVDETSSQSSSNEAFLSAPPQSAYGGASEDPGSGRSDNVVDVWGCIQGIQSRPQLNGRPCLVTGYDSVRHRYGVLAEGTSEAIALRPESVQLPAGTSVRILGAPARVCNSHAEIAEVIDDGYRVAVDLAGSSDSARMVDLSWGEVVVRFEPSL